MKLGTAIRLRLPRKMGAAKKKGGGEGAQRAWPGPNKLKSPWGPKLSAGINRALALRQIINPVGPLYSRSSAPSLLGLNLFWGGGQAINSHGRGPVEAKKRGGQLR